MIEWKYQKEYSFRITGSGFSWGDMDLVKSIKDIKICTKNEINQSHLIESLLMAAEYGLPD